MAEKLTAQQVSESEGLDDWRVILQTLHASFATGSFSIGADFTSRIARAADQANHHPDVTITYPRVHVILTTHEVDGVSGRDIALANTISTIAAELGIKADPTSPMQLEIAIDALDIGAVKPFWEAVLGYDAHLGDDATDPASRMPSVWFQQMDAPRSARNRIHIDVAVPHDAAADRIAAALAAGGTMVSDEGPAFWTLADPEGNEACVCTWQGRD